MASAAEASWNSGGFPNNYRLSHVDQAVEELRPYVGASGRTIVDATSASPHVVMGSGYTWRPD